MYNIAKRILDLNKKMAKRDKGIVGSILLSLILGTLTSLSFGFTLSGLLVVLSTSTGTLYGAVSGLSDKLQMSENFEREIEEYYQQRLKTLKLTESFDVEKQKLVLTKIRMLIEEWRIRLEGKTETPIPELVW